MSFYITGQEVKRSDKSEFGYTRMPFAENVWTGFTPVLSVSKLKAGDLDIPKGTDIVHYEITDKNILSRSTVMADMDTIFAIADEGVWPILVCGPTDEQIMIVSNVRVDTRGDLHVNMGASESMNTQVDKKVDLVKCRFDPTSMPNGAAHLRAEFEF